MDKTINSKRLKAARSRSGLSQLEMAKRLGVGKSTIGWWESGARNPTLENLKAIAKLFGTNTLWLTGESDHDGPLSQKGNGPFDAAAILADPLSPPSLRDLASSKELVSALKITPEEWEALRSLKTPPGFAVQGYITVLMALRGVTEP